MNNITLSAEQTSVAKYVGWYALFYIATMAVLTLINIFFGIDLSANGLPMLLVSGMGAGQMFARREKRAISFSERSRLSVGGMLVSYAFAGLYVVVLLNFAPSEPTAKMFSDILASDDLQFFVVALLVSMSAIQLIGLYFFIGMGARAWKQYAENDTADAKKTFE